MFKPLQVPNFERKINSMYKAGITLNSGACVDLDASDTSAITGSYGYSSLSAGSVKLATIVVASPVQREFGYALTDVTPTGPSVLERILRLASSYLKIQQGLNLAVYIPTPGDVFATSEFVGNLAGDNALTGYINLADTTKLFAACECFNGRLRLVQGSNPVRAQYLGTTTQNGNLVAMFRAL